MFCPKIPNLVAEDQYFNYVRLGRLKYKYQAPFSIFPPAAKTDDFPMPPFSLRMFSLNYICIGLSLSHGNNLLLLLLEDDYKFSKFLGMFMSLVSFALSTYSENFLVECASSGDYTILSKSINPLNSSFPASLSFFFHSSLSFLSVSLCSFSS